MWVFFENMQVSFFVLKGGGDSRASWEGNFTIATRKTETEIRKNGGSSATIEKVGKA